MNDFKRSVCIDFDGVLAKYDGWKGSSVVGEPFEGVRDFMFKLKKQFKVVVHTTRANDLDGYLAVRNFLKKNKIPYDTIEPKPIAVAYIDDRGINCDPSKDPNAYALSLNKLSELVPQANLQDTPEVSV